MPGAEDDASNGFSTNSGTGNGSSSANGGASGADASTMPILGGDPPVAGDVTYYGHVKAVLEAHC